MPREPGAHFGMLVDGIIVEDRVDQLAGRHRGLDPVEEADEFLMAMARHALADDRAVEDIERREQRGRAVADVIMGHRSGPALLHRQARLSGGCQVFCVRRSRETLYLVEGSSRIWDKPIRDEIIEELLQGYSGPDDLLGEEGLFKELKKRLLERALGAELTEHLGYDKGDPAGRGSGNSRNGYSSKTVIGDDGAIEIAVPRDRNSSFEPQIGRQGADPPRRF